MKRQDFPLVAAYLPVAHEFIRLETHSSLSRTVINSNSRRERERAAEIKPFCCNDALLNLYFRLYDCCSRSNKTALILQQPQDKRSRGRVLRHLYTPYAVRPPAQAAQERTHTHRTACTHSSLPHE
jgi:hypothetical protein